MAISADKMEAILKSVESLKISAQTNSDFGDYNKALIDLDQAVDLLKPTFKELAKMNSEDAKQYEPFCFKFAAQLADCYGMKGGNFRRNGELQKAESMYKMGSILEVRCQIPTTYNQINEIVLKLLRNPDLHKNLGQSITDAWLIVRRQIGGTNRANVWAWADFGLLNLLAANQAEAARLIKEKAERLETDEEDEFDFQAQADKAYMEFKSKGANRENFESTMAVIEHLKERFEEKDKQTASLMQKELDYLRENMPSF